MTERIIPREVEAPDIDPYRTRLNANPHGYPERPCDRWKRNEAHVHHRWLDGQVLWCRGVYQNGGRGVAGPDQRYEEYLARMSTYQAGDLAVLTLSGMAEEQARVRAVHVGNGWVAEDRNFYPDETGESAQGGTVIEVSPVVDVTLPAPHHAEVVLALLHECLGGQPAGTAQQKAKAYIGPLVEAYGRMARKAQRARQEDTEWPVSREGSVRPDTNLVVVWHGLGVPPLENLRADDEWRDSDGGRWRWTGEMLVSEAIDVNVNGVRVLIPEGASMMWHPELKPARHARWGWDSGGDHVHACSEHVGDLHVCERCHQVIPFDVPGHDS